MRVCKSYIIFFFSALLLTVQDLKSQPASFITIEGNGSPVVMLQGGASPLSLFDRHAKELAASYKVIRIERLNVSCVTNNKIIPANYLVRMESERLNHLLDSLNINEPVVLIGLSYGGLIALDFALNHMAKIRS
ncbi:MAG: Pimeloyl-ACP methyl ester carboxylesterase, partial [Chitinophagaceae bacterium]|nr:Pimeloyl-ACP methyl ester carboxylesterase [Chitinophagaceae bacterium]